MAEQDDKAGEPTDQELVRRCRAGCAESFPELVRRYQVPLLHFLQQRTRRRIDAEDLLQESFLRAFQRLEQYSEAWAFRSWLFTIAYRIFVSSVRGNGAVSPQGDDVTRIAAPLPPDGLEEQEWRQELWAIARRILGQEQYDIVWLRYVEGMSNEEIARVTGRSSVSVRTLLHRARKELLPHLANHEVAMHPQDEKSSVAARPRVERTDNG